MPQQSSPPYLQSAQQYPRTLVKWDDINAQNGKLQRTKTYLTLPTFTVADVWNGYSDIVWALNIEASVQFSFKVVAPSNPNYALCVSFHTDGVITRYLLWDATGSNLNQVITPYTGQTVAKNFRFEVWNTSQGASSNAMAINFTTSKLGNIDYRYGVDSVLASGASVTDFEAGAVTQAIAPQAGLIINFRADDIVTNTTWEARKYTGVGQYIVATLGTIPTIIINGIVCADLTGIAFDSTDIYAPFTAGDDTRITLLIFAKSNTAPVVNSPFFWYQDVANNPMLSFEYELSGKMNVGDASLITPASETSFGSLFVTDGTAVSATIPNYSYVDGGPMSYFGANPITKFKLIGEAIYLAEILIYDTSLASPSIADDLLAYINYRYSNNSSFYAVVPVAFPPNAISTTN